MTDELCSIPENREFPTSFLLLVFVFSTPFWLLGEAVNRFLPASIPINLPISSLMAVSPFLAAAVLTWRTGGSTEVIRLLGRGFDSHRIKRVAWYFVAFGLMPLIMVFEYLLLRLLRVPLPDLQFPALMLPVFALMFFIAALTEELGWQGYFFERLPDRWSALGASLFLGMIWAVWHFVPFLQSGRSLGWITWQCLNLIVTRVVIVWLFINTGKSVFAASLFHMMINVTAFIFPHFGSHYDPFITWILIGIVSVIVTILWGPRTFESFQWKQAGDAIPRKAVGWAFRKTKRTSVIQISPGGSLAGNDSAASNSHDVNLSSAGMKVKEL